jgi:hypothetical protein
MGVFVRSVERMLQNLKVSFLNSILKLAYIFSQIWRPNYKNLSQLELPITQFNKMNLSKL